MKRVTFLAIVLLAPFVLILGAATFAQGQSNLQPELPTYDTRYYTVHTDVSPDEAREAVVRMTAMAEEYSRRTKDFSGAVRAKFPFYLVRRQEDFAALGGIEGSAGFFNGHALVVHAPDQCDARTWHVLQHEGFHQFAAAVIGGDRPPWVNEGLAEYFGEALFTGDGYVSGVIPNWRLKRVQAEMRERQFLSIDDMMRMSIQDWNGRLLVINYDQSWAMVHFLAHGENGKYRAAFTQFMIDLGQNHPFPRAWQDNFGDGGGFEERWRSYWLGLHENPTADLYAKATVATVTSFVARAAAQHQTFDSFDELTRVAKTGGVKIAMEQWLPRKLLDDALADAQEMTKSRGAQWSIIPGAAKKPPQVLCRLGDGTRIVGHFTLANGRAENVNADISK